MEKLQQSDTKPAMYAEAFEELVLARKAKSEEIAALGKEIVQHLADCGEEGFTMETKFGFGFREQTPYQLRQDPQGAYEGVQKAYEGKHEKAVAVVESGPAL